MSTTKPTIHVIYYSMYGHVKTLIDAVVEGLKTGGADVRVFRVPEILADEVLAKMGADKLHHNDGVPVVDKDSWVHADGFCFGTPTRFGMMAAQMKAFWDATGGHWKTGALMGKPGGWVTSTASQNGGQETTIMTAVTQMAHHGMVFVPHGYATPVMFDTSFAHGISPYGVSTLAGDGSAKPLDAEIAAAKAYGVKLAKFTTALKVGMAAVEAAPAAASTTSTGGAGTA